MPAAALAGTDTPTLATAAPPSGVSSTPTATPTPPAAHTESSATGQGATPPAATAPAPTAPPEVSYDLKVPEGAGLDSAHVDGVKALAKSLGLSNYAAQKLIERDAGLIGAQRAASENSLAQQKAAWATETQSDPEIGGDKLPQTLVHAKAFRDRFFSPPFIALLESSGLGNHPEVIRGFARAGSAMAEASAVTSGQPTGQTKSIKERWFANSPEMKD